MTDRVLVIEEIRDLDAAWPELIELCEAQSRYHAGLLQLRLLPDWEKRQRERLAIRPEGLLLIAREAGVAIGLLNAYVNRNPYLFEDKYVYVENVFVSPGARRKGIAQALLGHAEAWSRSMSITRIDLDVVANNEPAIGFWRTAGYSERRFTMSKLVMERGRE